MQKTGTYHPGRRGFTLAEVMVAIAIFAVISAIALTLYQQLQKSFKQGENAAFQQQNTRIAFDRMISDLRLAGFNYNPDGDGTRPDEQIEMMWPNAITVRGDYDFETSDAATPESTLGGPSMTYGVVSTGNDEIVTYALGKPSGAGGTTLTFDADVSNVPRDGTLETVQIPNVFVDSNSPPYTLYRITLKPGGTPLSTIAEKVPIADDIRNLEFTYYDEGGNDLSDPNYAYTIVWGGADSAAAKESRSRVAKIEVRVVGMTRDPDLAYMDPTDTNPASRNFRKFELSGNVSPRNLGFVGVPDLDLDDPNTPTGLNVCAGHCNGLMATWNANPPGGGVVKYEVMYGPGILTQSNATDVYTTSRYISGLTGGSNYVVSVAAVDGGGNKSDPRAYSAATTVTEATVPLPPASLTGTAGGSALPGQIDLSWPQPVMNVGGLPACDANSPVRDLAGYRMWRGATSSFDPTIPAQVQQSWSPSLLPGTMGAPSTSDTGVVNCRTYYYKIASEDKCAVTSTTVTDGVGEASSKIPPVAPVNTTAINLGLNDALITWDPVTLDTDSPQRNIVIDTYKVWRASVPTASDPNQASYSLVYDGPVSSIGAPSYTDSNIPVAPPGEDYYYRVLARDDCPNESLPGSPALLTTCNFGGSISLSMSPGGNPVGGVQTLTIAIGGGVSTVRARIRVVDRNNGAVVLDQPYTSQPYTTTWNVPGTTVNGHLYDVIAMAENTSGCIATDIISRVGVITAAPCCVVVSNPAVSKNTTLGSVSGGLKNNQISYDIENQCGFDVDVDRFFMDWQNNASVLPCSGPSNPQLTAWTFTGFTNVILSPPVNPISGPSPVADFDLQNTPFTPYTLLSGTSVTQAFVFTEAMVFKCGAPTFGNTMRVEYNTSDGQTCSVQVIPNPLAITLCDVNLDPNCP